MGIIKYLGLEDWWSRYGDAKKNRLRESFSATHPLEYLETNLQYTSMTPTQVLQSMAKFVDDEVLCLDVYGEAERLARDAIDLHFLFMDVWRRYKKKDKIEIFEGYLVKDCAIFEEFLEDYKRTYSGVPNYPSFKELALFLERQGRITEAIEIAKDAINRSVPEDTSFEGRIKRLEKKL